MGQKSLGPKYWESWRKTEKVEEKLRELNNKTDKVEEIWESQG